MMRTGAKVFLHIIIDCTKKNKVCIYCVQMLINKKILKSCFLSIIQLFFFILLCIYAPVRHIWVCKRLIICVIGCVCVCVCVHVCVLHGRSIHWKGGCDHDNTLNTGGQNFLSRAGGKREKQQRREEAATLNFLFGLFNQQVLICNVIRRETNGPISFKVHPRLILCQTLSVLQPRG